MKTLAEIERTRRAYHRAPARDSVHRSAATFAIRDTARYRNNLSFLNHWKIKRGIPEVAARHTLRDAEGARIVQVYEVVDQARVYSYDLEDVAALAGLAELPGEGTWEIEFFSARNMFIPYPAVIQNGSAKGFFNQTHAFARTLNDLGENAKVNRLAVREASIDVIIDDRHDSFVELINGPYPSRGEVRFTLVDQNGAAEVRTVPHEVGPHAMTRYMLSELFPDLPMPSRCDRTLYVEQPPMDMFFSRVCGGVIRRDGGAFSANHSFYDCRADPEYWPIDPAYPAHGAKTFPLFAGLGLTLRLYPIIAPCDLDFHVALYDSAGERIETRRDVAAVESGTKRIIEIDLGALGHRVGAGSAELFVTPRGGDKVPTRLTFQLCYGTGRGLSSSINISLLSPYVFAPEGKPGRAWFEVAGEPAIENRIGLYHTAPLDDDDLHEVTATLYRAGDEQCRRAAFALRGKQAWAGPLEDLLPDYKAFLGGRNGFVYAESPSQFLRGLTLQTDPATGHSAGEHGF